MINSRLKLDPLRVGNW